MPTIKSNERELSQKIIQWFDEYIRGTNFPFKETTGEAGGKSDSTTLYPDVVLWSNRATNEACSFVEIKPPFGSKENLNRFGKKMTAFAVEYAFTWDFQTIQTFKFEDGKPKLVNSESIPVLSHIEEWKRGDKQAVIKTVIRKICENIDSLLQTGKPQAFIPDKVFFVNLIRQTTHQLLEVFEPFIHQAQQKKAFKETLIQYARVQSIPHTVDHIKILTNHVVYGLITKVIFYLTIRRYFNDLPPLDEVETGDLSSTIRKAFSKAREKDWQAVFEEDPIEQLGIPRDAHNILNSFFSELRAYHFGELPEDVIGQLFEDIIDPEKRHSLGQYFTREDLVDLVIATVVREADGVYGDPTCGSGTFLVRLYDRLKYFSNNRGNHKARLNQIWGFDVGKFPAELSTINLFRQDVTDLNNFPRVRRADIFDVKPNDTFDFPPPHSGSSAIKVQLKLPQFSALVGNFPYIRQELIEKEIKGYKKQLTRVIAQELYSSYPPLFEHNGIKPSHLASTKQIHTAIEKGWLDLSLSGQADIYSYIYLHTSNFLKSDGAFAIITSNAWLDVSYGTLLKQFFLDNFRVKMIIASWAEPWFEDAAVNTIITVLEKENDPKKRDENNVHFVKLKKKLSELIPYDLKFQSTKRWQRLDALVNEIEESVYKRDCTPVAQNISARETDTMRVRVIPQKVLKVELEEKHDSAKWGKYLRAPDAYFEILEKCKDKLVPLKEIADVRFGIKTGINDFFYLEKTGEAKGGVVKCRNARGWEGEIEEKFLKEVIKSPKEAENIIIDPSKLKFVIFFCTQSKAELRKSGDNHALAYIEWGEKQKTEDKMSWPQVPSVQSRKHWWAIKEDEIPEIIIPCGIDDTFKVYENSVKILNDKRLYRVYTKGNKVLGSLLNSALSSFFIEANSRITLGDGLLDLTVYEVEEIPILIPKALNAKDEAKLNNAFKKITKRKVKPIFEEIKQKDRITLDTAVLKALGLDPKEYLPRIYEGLSEMVRERLELPKMRKKQQKETVKLALDQIKQSVIEECLPQGPKRFPEAFFDSDLPHREFDRHPTSGKKLTYAHFFGNYEIKDEMGQKILSVDSEYKAEFALLLAKPGVYELRIPKDEKVVRKTLTKFKTYVENLKEQLAANANLKTHDWSIAERLANEILEEYGLTN